MCINIILNIKDQQNYCGNDQTTAAHPNNNLGGSHLCLIKHNFLICGDYFPDCRQIHFVV